MNGLVVVPIHHAIADPSHLAYILHSCHIKVIRWFSDFLFFNFFGGRGESSSGRGYSF